MGDEHEADDPTRVGHAVGKPYPSRARGQDAADPALLSDDDLLGMARLVLQNCMLGKVNQRTADVQRRAALDILDRGAIQHLTDEQLNAECRRLNAEVERRLAKRGAP